MDEELKKFKAVLTRNAILKIIIYFLISFFIFLIFSELILGDFLANMAVKYLGRSTYTWFVSNKPFMLFFSGGIIGVIIVYMVIRKMNENIGVVMLAMDKIVKEPEKKIELPSGMELLEGKINNIRAELVKNQNKANEAMQKKDNLIMYMAHDLKTPLTSIIGYLTLLTEEKNISKEVQNKYINIALKKAYRLEDLTNEFFDITRYNLQEIEINKNDIDLSYLFDQLIEECYPMFENKNLKVNIDKPKKLFYIGDGDKLARAFENIIKNAINYSYADSEIIIKIEKEDNKIKIAIKNKCDKIPKYKLEKIFEQFYRVDSSRTSSNGGAGLGLAITKKIIEMHDGTIKVKNDDEYIEFEILLP